MSDNDQSDRIELSRRKILGATGAIGVAGAGAGLGTSALFSDTEEFTNNQIRAGTTNLILEMALVEASNSILMDINFDVNEVREADGAVETGIQVGDMKPGDSLLVRLTVNVEDNPMYVSALLPGADSVDDSENRPNPEPENSTQAAGTNPDVEDGSGAGSGSDALGDGTGDDAGDLGNRTQVTLGYDSDRSSLHDNTLDGSLTPESGFDGSSTSTATDFLAALDSGFVYRGRLAPARRHRAATPTAGVRLGSVATPPKVTSIARKSLTSSSSTCPPTSATRSRVTRYRSTCASRPNRSATTAIRSGRAAPRQRLAFPTRLPTHYKRTTMAPPDNIPPVAPYSTIEVDVSFTGSPGPVEAGSVPPYAIHAPLSGPPLSTQQDAFVVEIHTTEYSGVSPPSPNTRIGYKILAAGSYTDVEIPIFPDYRFNNFSPNLQKGEKFPPKHDGTASIEGFVFSDLGVDYTDVRNLLGGAPVPAEITDPDPDLGSGSSVQDNEPLTVNSDGKLEDEDGKAPDRRLPQTFIEDMGGLPAANDVLTLTPPPSLGGGT